MLVLTDNYLTLNKHYLNHAIAFVIHSYIFVLDLEGIIKICIVLCHFPVMCINYYPPIEVVCFVITDQCYSLCCYSNLNPQYHLIHYCTHGIVLFCIPIKYSYLLQLHTLYYKIIVSSSDIRLYYTNDCMRFRDQTILHQ